jgi:hypothetical protein
VTLDEPTRDRHDMDFSFRFLFHVETARAIAHKDVRPKHVV